MLDININIRHWISSWKLALKLGDELTHPTHSFHTNLITIKLLIYDLIIPQIVVDDSSLPGFAHHLPID